jgi:hypothetical protein
MTDYEGWACILLGLIFIVLTGIMIEAAQIVHYLSIIASPPR